MASEPIVTPEQHALAVDPGCTRYRDARLAGGWLLVFLAINVGMFWFHWLGKKSFTGDFIMGYYASTAYWIASVEAGEWPHWIPYQSMGYPFAMNVQSGLHYPPLWVFPALRLSYTLYAANVVQLLHIVAGGLGMFFLVRAYWRSTLAAGIAGVAFELFGGFFSNAEHPDIIRAFSLVPWVLWASIIADGPARAVQLGRWTLSTRLTARNLALPLMVYLFITGAYVGNMLAGLFLLAVFLAVQGVCLAWHDRRGAAAGDTMALAAMTGLGVALAAAYLVPPLVLSSEYVRTHALAEIARWRLDPASLVYLAFPSSVNFNPTPPPLVDCSMVAMQLPIVLLPFGLVARRQDLFRLTPFLAMAGLATVMVMDTLVPISRLLVLGLPPLGLSRFPAGDYRLFIALAVLLVCAAGLRRVLEAPGPMPSSVAARLVLGSVLLAVAALVLRQWTVPFGDRRLSVDALAWQATGMLALVGLTMIWAVRPARMARLQALGRPVLGLAVIILMIATARPVATDMAWFWRTENVEKDMYAAQQVPLRENGRLSVHRIFEMPVDKPRPARQSVGHPLWLSWRGYVNGSYMMSDYGGNVSLGRQAVESDPPLRSFMEQGSSLRALEDDGLPLDDDPSLPTQPAGDPGPLARWRVEEYGRNQLVYRVSLVRPALVVENELYFPGWQGFLDGKALERQPVRVAGTLRGWKLPAGEHRLRLAYQTPGLAAGKNVAGAALAAYGLALLVMWLLCRHGKSLIAARRSTAPNTALPHEGERRSCSGWIESAPIP